MYRIIGADGREYGPYHPEQLVRFIREGRADANTRARREDETEWRKLEDFSEFHSILREPIPAQPESQAEAEASYGAAPGELSLLFCFNEAWDKFTRHLGPCLGATILVVVLQLMISIGLPVLGGIISFLIQGVLHAGLFYFFLNLVRTDQADIGLIFKGFSLEGWKLIALGVVSSVLVSIGLILCILPGVYLYVGWMFAGLLVIDKGLPFWEAMELSRRVVTQHLLFYFSFFFLSLLLILLGLALCGIGFFFAVPIILLASAVAYEASFVRPPVPGTR